MQGRIKRRAEVEGGAELYLKVPVLPDGDFFGSFREVFFVPGTESQGLDRKSVV